MLTAWLLVGLLLGPGEPVSLAGAGDEAILRHVDRGRTHRGEERRRHPPSRVPPEFLAATPRRGVLLLAEANRTEEHRRAFRLSLDGSAEERAPDALTALLSTRSYGCRELPVLEEHWILRHRPGKSTLTWARCWRLGDHWLDAARCREVYDWGHADIPVGTGERVARALWWLGRLRTEDEDPVTVQGAQLFCTAGTHGTLGLFSDGAAIRTDEGRFASVPVSEFWRGPCDADVRLVLGALLLGEIAPAWPPIEYGGALLPSRSVAAESAGAMLDRLLRDPSPDNLDLARGMARAVGELDLVDERGAIVALAAGFGEDGARPEARKRLLAALADTARQLEAAGDPSALRSIALGPTDLGCRALRRLVRTAPEAHHATLEELLRRADGADARRIFEVLAERDPARALRIAREIRSGDGRGLEPAAFDLLRRTGPIPDGAERVRALLDLAAGARSGSDRARAIDALVPEDAPRFVDEPVLDRLLVEAARTEADGSCRGAALRALGRRGGIARLDVVLEALLDPRADFFTHRDGFPAAVRLAARAGADGRRRLETALRTLAEGKRGPSVADEIAWAALSTDLRGLTPQLRKLGTMGPDDVEKPGGRHHLPRQVLALWQERDPVARAKLIAAFAFVRGGSVISGRRPERRDALLALLRTAAAATDRAGRREVVAFARRMEQRSWPFAFGEDDQRWRHELADRLAAAVGD